MKKGVWRDGETSERCERTSGLVSLRHIDDDVDWVWCLVVVVGYWMRLFGWRE